jgi:hypothetical protein
MLPSDPRVLAVAAALVGLVDALASERRAAPGDDLVALAGCGIERRALRRLQRDGKLPVERIGRKLYTRRSALLALVQTETAAAPACASTAAMNPEQAAREAYADRSSRVVRGSARS